MGRNKLPQKKLKPTVPFSPSKRHTVQTLRKQGKTLGEIGAELDVDPSTVSRGLKKLGRSHQYYKEPVRSGRPPKVTAADRHALCVAIESGVEPDATSAHATITPHLSVTTTRRILRNMGLNGRRRCAVAHITEGHAEKHFNIANERGEYTDEDWDSWVFTDESRISLWGSDGCLWCRRRPGEALLPRNVKPKKAYGGGGLMVWGYITKSRVGRLHC